VRARGSGGDLEEAEQERREEGRRRGEERGGEQNPEMVVPKRENKNDV